MYSISAVGEPSGDQIQRVWQCSDGRTGAEQQRADVGPSALQRSHAVASATLSYLADGESEVDVIFGKPVGGEQATKHLAITGR